MLKTTIYGLPLNPMPLLNQLQGASFCVSFATADKLGKQLDQAIGLVGEQGIVLVDNGAFSTWMAKRKGDKSKPSKHLRSLMAMSQDEYVDAFAAWANPILERCPQAIAVLPDQIDGDVETNAQLVAETMTMFPADRVMPIWHMHEPISYLLQLCEGFGYVGIGSSAQYAAGQGAEWDARIAEAFAAIDQWEAESNGAYVRPRLHMMRCQSQAHRFAFDSADSTNLAVNHNRGRKAMMRQGDDGQNHVAKIAARLDGVIQASAGPEADHQAKRPVLEHLEMAAWRAEMYAGFRSPAPAVSPREAALAILEQDNVPGEEEVEALLRWAA